ncbi:ribonuclease P protein subunit p25-like protein isoform X2 [Anneissia japonica]|nr:ribonuclease P protein subunit p25-like protein isoform X2 [Anneissia japonica]XP_033097542.1 ribonuclease P protein subunit p25-like protein isoform X2 [Anneissia japonica]
MRIKNGSRVRNLIGFAVKRLKEDGTRQMTFSGTGLAVSKTITCAEIMKRKVKNLHQITKLFRKETEEYWEPIEEGLDRLKVTRSVPSICILLSKDLLDASQPGYQAPGIFDALWSDSVSHERRRKQPVKNHKRHFQDKQKVTHKNEDKSASSVKKNPQQPKSSKSQPGNEMVQKTKKKDEAKSKPFQKVGDMNESNGINAPS